MLEVTKELTGHPFAEALAAPVPRDEATTRGPYGAFTFAREEDVLFSPVFVEMDRTSASP